MKLSEWIKLPQEVRMAGIDLTSPCVILEKRRNWTYRMNRMFAWLGIDNDVPNLIKAKIHRIHVCDHNSRGHDICCNPLHWYIGTMSENVMSLSLEKRQAGGRACAGRPCTWSDKINETRRKNGTDRGYSSSAKGRTLSGEWKEKVSEGMKRYHDRERCRRAAKNDPLMGDFEEP